MGGFDVALPAMDNGLDLSHWTGHVISIVAVIGSLAGLLPAIAGLAGLIWYCVQLYESKTVQHWLRTRRSRRIAQALMLIQKLEAEDKRIDNIYGDNPTDGSKPR